MPLFKSSRGGGSASAASGAGASSSGCQSASDASGGSLTGRSESDDHASESQTGGHGGHHHVANPASEPNLKRHGVRVRARATAAVTAGTLLCAMGLTIRPAECKVSKQECMQAFAAMPVVAHPDPRVPESLPVMEAVRVETEAVST